MWTEADMFCQKRGQRLPTEAEWEYAARGPVGLIYPRGNEYDAGNVISGNNNNPWDMVWDVGLHDVGSKPGGVSWIGAYNLSGNISEWVADWAGTYPLAQQANPTGPTGPEGNRFRILRGGSWSDSGFSLSAIYRLGTDPDGRSSDSGFRCGGAVTVLP